MASVRLAALEELYGRKPDSLRQTVELLLEHERDPKIADRARSIRSELEMTRALTEAEKRQLSEGVQKTLAKLENYNMCSVDEGAIYAGGKEYEDSNGRKRWGGQFVLLTRQDEFMVQYRSAWWDSGRAEVVDRAKAQKAELFRQAREGSGEEAHKALNGIAWILSNNGLTMNEAIRFMNMSRCAQIVKARCAGPNECRGQAAQIIENLLTSKPDLEGVAAMYLIEGLRELWTTGAIDAAEVARICTKALDVGIQQQNLPSKTLSVASDRRANHSRLLDLLKETGARDKEAIRILTAMSSEKYPYDLTRKQAAQLLDEMKNGIDKIDDFRKHNVDTQTSVSIRAGIIKEAVMNPFIDADKRAGMILDSCYGKPLEGSNDPRLDHLSVAMRISTDSRVRVAAAYGTLSLCKLESREARQAVGVLADVSWKEEQAHSSLSWSAWAKLKEIAKQSDLGKSLVEQVNAAHRQRSYRYLSLKDESDKNPESGKSNEERAKDLKALLSTPDRKPDNAVRAIYKTCGGKKFETENDPRLAVLLDALVKEKDEAVRLAIAHMLTSEQGVPAKFFSAGIEALHQICFWGQNEECVNTARHCISKFSDRPAVVELSKRCAADVLCQNEGVIHVLRSEFYASGLRASHATPEAAAADFIKILTDRSINSTDAVRAIYRGLLIGRIKDDDPRMFALRRLLDESRDDRVRLAAADAIRRSGGQNAKLIQVISEIEASGSSEQLKKDATLMLESLAQLSPALKAAVEAERLRKKSA